MNILTEYDECLLLVEYLDILINQGKVKRFTHVPNETFTRDWGTKMKNKRMGVRVGFPDYVIMTKTKIILIEMKRSRGGVASPEQKAWVAGASKRGVPSYICHGFNEAKRILDSELA